MPDLIDRIEEHRRSLFVSRRIPVVFCVKCGSTNLDQNSVTEIRCYNCGNSAMWDSSRFSIRRGVEPNSESDVVKAVENEDRARQFVRRGIN